MPFSTEPVERSLRLELHRVEGCSSFTKGVILANSNPECVSLEGPFSEDTKVSHAIPAGTYIVILTSIHDHKLGMGVLPRLVSVPGFPGLSGVMMHASPDAFGSRGHILVGSSFTPDNKITPETALVAFRSLFKKLLDVEYHKGVIAITITNDFLEHRGGPNG